MRIGYLTSQYPATSHTFISREVNAVRDLGVQLDTFSIRPPSSAELKDPAIAAEAEKTFTVLRQPPGRIASAHLRALFTRPIDYFTTLGVACSHRVPGAKAFFLSFAYFAEAIVLAREIERRGITRLHNHFANSGATVGFLAAKLARIPWSFTMHGISETDYPAGLLLGRKIAEAEFVACVSYFGRAQAMRLVQPDQWPKLKIVHCGLALDRLPGRPKSKDVRRITSVGRLSAEKGQAGLLEAFATIAGEFDKVTLHFIGDGPEREVLESRAAELGLAEKVVFAGGLGETDTLEQIAQSDALVLPSFMEGLPIVLMEAMAVGTPVIASRVAGIPELVEDGRSGLLFTPSDWDELASCMRRLIEDGDLRTGLAQQGQITVEKEFDIRRSAERMLTLFEPTHERANG
jgi:glycosyltransferase involved in cell wall biosynthesis